MGKYKGDGRKIVNGNYEHTCYVSKFDTWQH